MHPQPSQLPLSNTFIHHIKALEEAKRLHLLFSQHNIPCLFLKGIALLKHIYPLGTRPMLDIDVLVPKHHFHNAHNLLLSHGYTWKPWTSRPFTSTHIHERDYISPLSIHVDLHHNLDIPLRWNIAIPDIFTHAVAMPEAPAGMLRPCNEHMVLHAAIHAVKDGMRSPKSLRDIEALLKRPDTSLPRLTAFARQWKASTALELCMSCIVPSQRSLRIRCARTLQRHTHHTAGLLLFWLCVLQKKGAWTGTVVRACVFRWADFATKLF